MTGLGNTARADMAGLGSIGLKVQMLQGFWPLLIDFKPL